MFVDAAIAPVHRAQYSIVQYSFFVVAILLPVVHDKLVHVWVHVSGNRLIVLMHANDHVLRERQEFTF